MIEIIDRINLVNKDLISQETTENLMKILLNRKL